LKRVTTGSSPTTRVLAGDFGRTYTTPTTDANRRQEPSASSARGGVRLYRSAQHPPATEVTDAERCELSLKLARAAYFSSDLARHRRRGARRSGRAACGVGRACRCCGCAIA